jgi:hypothetical protein
MPAADRGGRQPLGEGRIGLGGPVVVEERKLAGAASRESWTHAPYSRPPAALPMVAALCGFPARPVPVHLAAVTERVRRRVIRWFGLSRLREARPLTRPTSCRCTFDRDVFHASSVELPAIDIHSL